MVGEGRLTPAEFAAAVTARLPESPLVVALSGGPDSAALAWAVASSGRRARAVSIDHGLDGSATLMDAAEEIAFRLGMRHEIVRVSQRSGSETDLREARLAALEAAASGEGEVVLTGHTRDDLAETVLGNVMRGTGTTGLAGIPVRRGRWARPLLAVGRADTRSVASAVGLPFADDPQNADLTVRRNRLRRETIPDLAAAYNPALVSALARLGEAAASDDELLERRASMVPVRRMVEGVRVPAASLQVLPGPVAARVARRALQEAGGAVVADSIAAVLAAASSGERSSVSGGIDVVREGPWVTLVADEPSAPEPMALVADRPVVWGEWRFEPTDHLGVGRFATALAAPDRCTVRAARPGDRISVGSGSKTVAEAMAEAAVPRRIRARWPVVECDGTIVWITGVRSVPVGAGRRVTVRAVRRRT